MSIDAKNVRASDLSQQKVVRKGTVLTEAQAVEIYSCKLRLLDASERGEVKLRGQSTAVGEKFSISSKTVKDIWQHKTWKYATFHLWPIVMEMKSSKIVGSADHGKVP